MSGTDDDATAASKLMEEDYGVGLDLNIALCDHDDTSDFRERGGGYFNDAFRKKMEVEEGHWPSECANCKYRFVTHKPAANEKEVKVTTAKPAYLCKNASDANHPCLHALCKVCKDISCVSGTKRSVEAKRAERDKRARVMVQPGEFMNERTGAIEAVF